MSDWITWEFAQDRYKVSKYWLEIMSCVYPQLCDNKNCLIRDLWRP